MATRTVYHTSNAKNARQIMQEGLKPLATNRPPDLALVDLLFDREAEKLGLPPLRKGIFAWPKQQPNVFQDSITFAVEVDPATAYVFHQGWVDLAWGTVTSLVTRIKILQEIAEPDARIERMEQLGLRGAISTFSELARNYWESGMLVCEYDPQALNNKATLAQREFPGLLVHLDHEVALGMQTIIPGNIRQL